MVKSFINIIRKNDKLLFYIVFMYFFVKQIYVYVDGYNDVLNRAYPIMDEESINITFTQIALFSYLTYRYGFLGRGLIGSIIYMFYYVIDKIYCYISKSHIDYIWFGAVFRLILIICLNVLLFVIVYKLFKVLKEKIGNKAYYFFVLIGLVYSILYTGFEYRYNDYVLFILQFLSIYLVLKRKEQFAIIPMICSVLIHEGAILLTCPVVFAIIIAVHINDDMEIKRKVYSRMFVFGIVLCSLSLYFIKFQQYVNPVGLGIQIEKDMLEGLHLPVTEENIQLVENKTVIIDQVLYSEGTTTWNTVDNNNLYLYVLQMLSCCCVIIYFISLIPFMIIVLPRFKQKLSETDSMFRRFEILVIQWFGVLALIPFIVFKEDTGRWILFFWMYYCLLGVYGLYSNSDFAIGILDDCRCRIERLCKKDKWNIVPVIAYYVSLIPMAVIPVGGIPINVIYLTIHETLEFILLKYCPGIINTIANAFGCLSSTVSSVGIVFSPI